MTRTLLIALLGAACVEAAPDDAELAANDVIANMPDANASDANWAEAATLHANTPLRDLASANSRRVHALWIAGSPMNPLPLTIDAHAGANEDVRIAVLGPLDDAGHREVLAADGYAARKRDASVSLDVVTRGEHLVVVGSHDLATETAYQLAAECDVCESRVDVLATPKAFGLVGDESGLVSALLGDVMLGYAADIELELLASPPLHPSDAMSLGRSVASGTQVNALVPASLTAGDDIRLVVRESGGRVVDTGITTRYAPNPTAFARLDAIVYDATSMQIAGVVGMYEGQADLRLRSETHDRDVARHVVHRDFAGQVGNGLSAFDATFVPEVPAAPGEVLSIGFINGNGDYRRLGCFEYCNNLSGGSSCTGGARSCPL